ncbi:hypothetical protein KR054_001365, partial [Drosophila jambulina]
IPISQVCMLTTISTVLSHPIDLIRVNIEANVHRYSRLTMRHMLEKMSRHGLPGFYYGVLAAVTRCTVEALCSYHLFRNLHELVYQHPYYIMLRPYNNTFLRALCSFGGGIVSTPFAKLSVMRSADLTRKSFHRRNYGALASGLRCMYRKGGVNYLFIGWEMNGVNNAVATALYAPVSYFVKALTPLIAERNNSWVKSLAQMALAGGIINVLMTPMDTLSVMALNHSRYSDFSYRNMCKQVLKRHGYKGFFFGVKPSLISLIPNILLISVATRLMLKEKVI